MTNIEPYPGTQTVLRAVTLLKAFSDAQPELGLSDLARLVGLNKTTAYRLLTALESEGMVARNPDTDAYRLGPEIIALGGRALRANDLRAISRPELEALAEQTRETATLEVLVADEVLILDEVAGGFLVGITPSIGTRWPAHAASTGKVLLAHLPEAEREAFLRTPRPALTPGTIAAPEALRRELDRVRQQGYATAVEELEPDYVALGVPLRNHDGRVVAAISIGGPTTRLVEERFPQIVTLLVAAADRISARLGYRP